MKFTSTITDRSGETTVNYEDERVALEDFLANVKKIKDSIDGKKETETDDQKKES